MVRISLSERVNPPEPPERYVIDRTTGRFVKQVMLIIHQYYYNDGDSRRINIYEDRLDISSYSHKILLEYYKHNPSFHLPAEGYFGEEQLYEELSKSKHMKFFELLDCMIGVLYEETRKGNGGYLSYCKMVDELNDSMRKNGIGYKIVGGELTIQTEPVVFEKITEPCLMALNQHGFFDADNFIMIAFEAYEEGNFKEAISNAYNALENVIYELCQMEDIDLTENKKFPYMLRRLLENKDVPNQIKEHTDSIATIMQTVAATRNERAAHGREVMEVNSSMVRYVIDMACADMLFLVRLFCEEM